MKVKKVVLRLQGVVNICRRNAPEFDGVHVQVKKARNCKQLLQKTKRNLEVDE